MPVPITLLFVLAHEENYKIKTFQHILRHLGKDNFKSLLRKTCERRHSSRAASWAPSCYHPARLFVVRTGFWDRLFLVLFWITPGISDWSKYSIRTPRSKIVRQDKYRQKWQMTHCIHQFNFFNPIPHHPCKFNFNRRRLVYANPYAVNFYNITYNCKIYSSLLVSDTEPELVPLSNFC